MANENPKSTQPKTATESSATLPLTPSASTLSDAELKAKAKELEEKEKMLLQRERDLDAKDTKHTLSPATTPTTGSADDNEMVAVVNNGRRAIGVPGGFVLYPGTNTVPRYAWKQMFDKSGRPTPGAAEHLNSQNGQRPEVQEVSLRNLSQLPDEHAVAAITASSDEAKLAAHEQTEARDSVRAAVSARLKALRSQKDAKK